MKIKLHLKTYINILFLFFLNRCIDALSNHSGPSGISEQNQNATSQNSVQHPPTLFNRREWDEWVREGRVCVSPWERRESENAQLLLVYRYCRKRVLEPFQIFQYWNIDIFDNTSKNYLSSSGHKVLFFFLSPGLLQISRLTLWHRVLNDFMKSHKGVKKCKMKNKWMQKSSVEQTQFQ